MQVQIELGICKPTLDGFLFFCNCRRLCGMQMNLFPVAPNILRKISISKQPSLASFALALMTHWESLWEFTEDRLVKWPPFSLLRSIILNFSFMVNLLHLGKILEFTTWILIIVNKRKNTKNIKNHLFGRNNRFS